MKQVNPITARLRDILRNYSSAQVLNELLQNADDAGARGRADQRRVLVPSDAADRLRVIGRLAFVSGSTQFKVLLDSRSFGTRNLLSPSLAHTQGPALYQFDDAEFNPDDYESIQRVGDGTKMGDPTKTGMFGLGFNSVYHLTDTPMFISGSDFVVFDPRAAPEGSTASVSPPPLPPQSSPGVMRARSSVVPCPHPGRAC